jgi:dienelactone hydrolase
VDGWSIRRRVIAVAVLVALLAGVQAAWPKATAYAKAMALVGDAVLGLPVRPLTWVTPDPVVGVFTWPDGGIGVLTMPGGDDRSAGLILMLGAEPAEPDDPRVRRLTESLARSGLATLLVRSELLINGDVTAAEVPLLIGAFEALRDHPQIRDDRVAFVGLSVGGSVQMIAAAHPSIAEEVWFVFALGPYHEAGRLAAEVMSGAYRTSDGIETWEPDDTALRVVERTLLVGLPEGERARIDGGEPAMTPDGQAAQALLERPSLARAETLVGELSPDGRAELEAISPRHHLDGLRAPLYLLHDRNDAFIPWPHSDDIAAAYEPEVYHRLDIFDHAEPRPSNLDVLLRDGWRLLRLFARIIEEGN